MRHSVKVCHWCNKQTTAYPPDHCESCGYPIALSIGPEAPEWDTILRPEKDPKFRDFLLKVQMDTGYPRLALAVVYDGIDEAQRLVLGGRDPNEDGSDPPIGAFELCDGIYRVAMRCFGWHGPRFLAEHKMETPRKIAAIVFDLDRHEHLVLDDNDRPQDFDAVPAAEDWFANHKRYEKVDWSLRQRWVGALIVHPCIELWWWCSEMTLPRLRRRGKQRHWSAILRRRPEWLPRTRRSYSSQTAAYPAVQSGAGSLLTYLILLFGLSGFLLIVVYLLR